MHAATVSTDALQELADPDDLAGATQAVSSAYRALCRHIEAGQFRPGERIGTERALSAELGVGRAALRKAIDLLEARSHVQRWVGRTGGLYAADSLIHRQLNTVLGVPEIVRRQGRQLRTQVLAASLTEASHQVARALDLAVADPVFKIRRVRFVDDTSWSLDTSYLAAAKFPGLLDLDLTGSLYETFTRHYGFTLDHADETIELHYASAEEAQALKIDVAAPLFELWRVTFDADDGPLEFAHDLFRADRTRVHMQKHGVNWKRSVSRARALL